VMLREADRQGDGGGRVISVRGQADFRSEKQKKKKKKKKIRKSEAPRGEESFLSLEQEKGDREPVDDLAHQFDEDLDARKVGEKKFPKRKKRRRKKRLSEYPRRPIQKAPHSFGTKKRSFVVTTKKL